ncbi:Solute carrier family 25 member 38 [Tetrabaena socialis]|uniref:Solute carrier family 25 member 38 n=1 Tax=Tetrabaena socialis TaxID=47790 RepID=A0A2J7ZT49_9CHLO|nr:Solute carrier family 25 member 38 [Tetrabaena socialis]|eukprot:PNH03445.1 Solute carrier family 25 member 38 [Tetrabaena socialis]
MAPAAAAVKGAAGAATDVMEGEAPKQRPKKPPGLASALSGAISGSLISACVQPLDVVRTKMQADAARGLVRGTLATAGVVMTEQAAMHSHGAAPRILKRTTQTALVWTMYEELVPRITALGFAARAAWDEAAGRGAAR